MAGACGLSSPEDIDWLDAQALTLPVRVHGAGLATANGELNEIVTDGAVPEEEARSFDLAGVTVTVAEA